MKISGAIFDMDGTLLDSTEMWRGAAGRYITSLRKTPEPDLGEKTKDMTLPELCSYLKSEYAIATTEEKIAKGFNTILREDYLHTDRRDYRPRGRTSRRQRRKRSRILRYRCRRRQRKGKQSQDTESCGQIHRELRRTSLVLCFAKRCRPQCKRLSQQHASHS